MQVTSKYIRFGNGVEEGESSIILKSILIKFYKKKKSWANKNFVTVDIFCLKKSNYISVSSSSYCSSTYINGCC